MKPCLNKWTTILQMVTKEYVIIITDNFFLSAGVRSFVVVRQILGWQQPHWHVLVKRLQILSVNLYLRHLSTPLYHAQD